MRLKVKQIASIGNNKVRLILVRPGLRSRVEPLPQTQNQRMAQDIARQAQQAFNNMFPGKVIVGGSMGSLHKEFTVHMVITEDEYASIGKPGVNDRVVLNINKMED